MNDRERSVPHRRSTSQQSASTTASSATASSHRSPTLAARTPAQPQRRSNQQIVERIVSPGSVLFVHRTRPQGLTAQQPTSAQTRGGAISRNATSSGGSAGNMDRRHPSSFQQLEKVTIYSEGCGCAHKANMSITAGRRHLCNGKPSQSSPTLPSTNTPRFSKAATGRRVSWSH
jgi:hypothetical protein